MTHDEDIDEEIGHIEERLALVRERLAYKRMGLSGKSLPALDFESHIEEDLEWLLSVLGGDLDEKVSQSLQLKQGVEVVRDEVLRMPIYVERAETKMQESLVAIRAILSGAQASQKALRELRNEVDLFKATPEVKLTLVLKDLEKVKKELRQEKRTNAFLERRTASLTEEIKKLKSALDNLPPTWQERVLTEEAEWSGSNKETF